MTLIVLLQYLLYMNPSIGLNYGITTQNCYTFQSGTPLRTCNRVCHRNIPTDLEVQEVKSFFNKQQFTWFVDTLDTQSQKALQNNGLKYKASFPAMVLELELLKSYSPSEDIRIQEIDVKDILIEDWIAIIAEAFHAPQEELSQMIAMFQQKMPHALKLYVGFYQEKAITAGMCIDHGEVVSLHWIGVLPEYRNKGAGSALTHQALCHFKQRNCKHAVLIATQSGKSLYEKLGFEEYIHYNVYGNY